MNCLKKNLPKYLKMYLQLLTKVKQILCKYLANFDAMNSFNFAHLYCPKR
jgi:hypothetical protein